MYSYFSQGQICCFSVSTLYYRGMLTTLLLQLKFPTKCISLIKYQGQMILDRACVVNQAVNVFPSTDGGVIRLTKRKRRCHRPINTQGNDSICADESHL